MKNDNKTLKFKTNINCGGCVAQVKQILNDAEGICHWEVDTDNQDKVLYVQSKGIAEEEVIQRVSGAGFKIQLLKQ